jgi:hypothetical protein
LLGGGEFGFVGCSWAGAFVCGGDAGVVDCCCAGSKHDARSTKAGSPGKVAVRMYAPSTCGVKMPGRAFW